jgi:hypothetical protein
MPNIDTLLIAEIHKAQFWLVAGFILLGWVFARRQMALRRRVNTDARAANRELKKIRTNKQPAVPLCDAPPETQRWQAALFDLQRELKADLDTRIAVVQSLVRLADQRIARLEALEGASNLRDEISGGNQDQLAKLVRDGHTASEIATRIGVPIGDVEMTIATMRVG